jgi:hypothetical protein
MSNNNVIYNDTCCFCLSEIKEENSKITLNCNHIYHNICWTQYGKKICPLCKQNTYIKNKEIVHSNIKTHNDEEYVWIFGSFVAFSNSKRTNTVLLNISNKKFISGYFWRLFDNNISKELELNYQIYIQDNTKKEFIIDIGTMNYTISFDGYDVSLINTNQHNIFENKICIQKSQQNRFRPILRMKWKDIINNLLIVGIHDSAFFDNIYIYYDNNNVCFFDIHNQEKINIIYKNDNYNDNITINNKIYKLDKNNNVLVDENNDSVYEINVFDKQNIGNY